MLQKMTDYMDRSILDEAKKREEFLNAQNQEQSPLEQKPDFFNPDQLKLSSLKYQALLDSGWCVISRPGELGNNRSGYEIVPRGTATDGRFRDFADHLPSYLHLKKVSADESPNKVIVYLFKDPDDRTPVCYPMVVDLKY